MEKCATCKHWKKSAQYEIGHSFGIGICQAIPMFWDATEWSDNNRYDGRIIKEEYKDAKAFAQDGSDYRAYLMALPDFGCVLHEPV